MKYKGFYGSVEYSAADNVIYGEILDIKGSFSYHGVCVNTIQEAFAEMVDHYIELCKEEGIDPTPTAVSA